MSASSCGGNTSTKAVTKKKPAKSKVAKEALEVTADPKAQEADKVKAKSAAPRKKPAKAKTADDVETLEKSGGV